MTYTLIFSLIVSLAPAKADEIKTEAPAAPTVTADYNQNEVVPSYTNIDYKNEKEISYSWGSLFIQSVTKGDEHQHEHEATEKLQTNLNVRYTCKNGVTKSVGPKRFEFCGYAKSEPDLKERETIVQELSQSPEHKGKSKEDLQKIYDQEYNDRIVDPIKNISEKKTGDKISIEITIRQNVARFGACEEKITSLAVPVDCK